MGGRGREEMNKWEYEFVILNIYLVVKNCVLFILVLLLEIFFVRGFSCWGKVRRYLSILVTYDWGYVLKFGRGKVLVFLIDDYIGIREISLRRCRIFDMRILYISLLIVFVNVVIFWDVRGSVWNRGFLDCKKKKKSSLS